MNIFDSHLHIIDKRFPIQENNGYLPDYFSVTDYLDRVNKLDIKGGVVVSGSFQGFDQTYLVDALEKLGNNFVGVTQLPYDTSNEEINKLHKLGVQAVRFNVRRGGSEDLSKLAYFSQQVYDLVGWHTELYISSIQLKGISSVVETLPAVSVDHLGLTKSGLSTLFELVDKGVKVKATGFGRTDFDPVAVIQEIHSINQEALMFGTDLPSTRAKRKFENTDVAMIIQALGKEEAEKVLFSNGFNWYRGRRTP